MLGCHAVFRGKKNLARPSVKSLKFLELLRLAEKKIRLEDLLAARKVKHGTFAGVDAPDSGVYNNGYQVVHLGYGVDPNVQVPTILDEAGVPVFLLGKVADIVQTTKGKLYPGVDSLTLFNQLLRELKTSKKGFFLFKYPRN